MILPNKFYLETKKRYQKRGLETDLKKLKTFTDGLYYQAKQNYYQLPEPKFCSQKAYISIWLNQEIAKDIAQKSLKSFKINDPPNNLKAITEFYKNYPPPSFPKTNQNKNQNNRNNKKQQWLAVIKERNQFSLDNHYKSRIDNYINDFYIPISEYKKFLKNIDNTIDICKDQIYSNWSFQPKQNLDNYCLVCNSNIFPFKTTDDFLAFFTKKNKFYKNNKEKIKVEFTNESRTEYIKENDTFKVTIKQNTHLNHKIIELIHEFSHVETMAKILRQNKFITIKPYTLEKIAIKKEINFLQKYFSKALIARLGNILRMICQTLFEIEIYQNPQKDPNKIYLKYLKKCSKDTKQSDSWNYLSNPDILYKNFTQLIYAVAYTNILNEILIKNKRLNLSSPKKTKKMFHN